MIGCLRAHFGAPWATVGVTWRFLGLPLRYGSLGVPLALLRSLRSALQPLCAPGVPRGVETAAPGCPLREPGNQKGSFTVFLLIVFNENRRLAYTRGQFSAVGPRPLNEAPRNTEGQPEEAKSELPVEGYFLFRLCLVKNKRITMRD